MTVLMCMLFNMFMNILKCSSQEIANVNENFFEGDIMGIDGDTVLQLVSLSNRHGMLFASDSTVSHGAAIGEPSALWPDGKVYYEISEEFISNEVAIIESAFEAFHLHTCIKLINRSGQDDYIKIVKSVGCWSYIGRRGGLQYLSLGSSCLEKNGKGLAIHELMHSIGFYHEQSRWDRDDNIQILWSNIVNETGISNNFLKYGLDALQNLHTDYDYNSIMHYEANSFGINGQQTIIPKKSGARIGQRNGLSDIDIKEINLLYKCHINLSSITKRSSADKIRWGIRFSRHRFSNLAESPDECIRRCKQNVSCDAVTFDSGNTSMDHNCYVFSLEDNFIINLDLTNRYGIWERNKAALIYREEYKICWGTRLMIHYRSFHAQNPDQCVQSCIQNSNCQAITFYHDSGYEGDNCFHFNSRNNYYTTTDPDKQYGVWKKDTSFQCKEQKSDIKWGTRFMRHYLGFHAQSPNDCTDRCKDDISCDAITFFKGNTNSEFNCYFFNSAYKYDSVSDPTNNWGVWLKNKTAEEPNHIRQAPVHWGLRLLRHFDSCNVRNVAQCKRLCEQMDRCDAMTFEICRHPNINCYFFNNDDNFVSEPDPTHKWATWKKIR